MSNKLQQIQGIKTFLHEKFKIKDLGELNFFLGLEIVRSQSGIHVCQKKFTLDLLAESRFIESKPVVTLMSSTCKLVKEGTAYEDVGAYRRLIGKLLYLTISRPDNIYVVQQLSQFLNCPTVDHVTTAHRIL